MKKENSAIKITPLRCGTMTVRPYEAYIKDRSPLAKRVELPVNAFLIEHPVHGKILVDTGWSADVEEILPQRLKNFYRPHVGKGETAREQLHAMGIEPEDIDLVLLTHLDVDHTCALKDFSDAKRIACAELEYFYSCRTVYRMREVWDTFMPLDDRIEKIHYRASVLGPVGRGFDLFGDDSVLCIYCPGHTDGIFSVMINRGPSNRFIDHGDGKYGGEFAVIASDLAFSDRNLDDEVVPGYGFDREQQLSAVRFLKELKKDSLCRGILYSHSEIKTPTVF